MVKAASIYVHTPFCTKKCPYCHFYTLPFKEGAIDPFLEGIRAEWLHKKDLFSEYRSIYVGGGTPSLLGIAGIKHLFEILNIDAKEITIEINPEDATKELLKLLYTLKINRVSFGVQSLVDTELVQIGRTHTAKKSLEALFLAKDAGINNISIDLMIDLPSQTEEKFTHTLSMLDTLPITHLSLYNMQIEQGSTYFKKKENIEKMLPSQEVSYKMLQLAEEKLSLLGLHRYEISAFARKGFESIHNMSYWKYEESIGLGPSAFSYLNGTRSRNICHLKKYLKTVHAGKDPTDFSETLSYPKNIKEQIAIGLRMLSGIDLMRFEKIPTETLSTINNLTSSGLLSQKGSILKLTQKGLLFYDSVAIELI